MNELPTFRVAINRMSFVEKPEKPNWETLNTSFLNVEVDVMRFCNAIYCGHPFCPWMEGKRSADNFMLAQHIGVDMDSGDERADIDRLEQHPLVAAYGAIIYETPSHTFQSPRSRVIFILDEPITTSEGYKAAIQVVTDLFDGADPACVDAARFFYGNGKLRRSGRFEGISFNPEARLPLTELRRFARIRHERLQREQTTQRAQWVQRQTPRQESARGGDQMTLLELRDSLARVHPYAMGYGTWLKLIAAIRHVYGPAAFDVVKAWSDVPGEKPVTAAKWESLQDSHPNPAGYGTIVQIIKDLGR